MEGFAAIFDLLNHGGVLVILVGIIYGGYKRWWVWGWQYEELKAAAQRNAQVAEKATDVAAISIPASRNEGSGTGSSAGLSSADQPRGTAP